jgi:hypothetical protein
MADMFGLFKQLADRQNAMQEQLVALLSTERQRGQPRSQADSQAELEQAAEQRRLTLKSWAEEPKEIVWVEPTLDEVNVMKVYGEFPPRVFRINGLEFPIRPGEPVPVPQSVAAMVRFSQGKKPLARPPQAINQIEDPQRGQFLANSQVIRDGRPGTVGEGQLIAPALAHGTAADPIDVRYDAFGR